MIFSKWLLDEELRLAKNSSIYFELISTMLASMDCDISMKMLIKISDYFISQFSY